MEETVRKFSNPQAISFPKECWIVQILLFCIDTREDTILLFLHKFCILDEVGVIKKTRWPHLDTF